MRKTATKRIDWAAVHATLAVHAAAPVIADDDSDRAERLLTERTRVLAAGKRVASHATQKLLVMRVGAERYALSLAAVREVIDIGRVAALPGARPTILGIVNWRGDFALVFDLAAVVGAERLTKPRRAIVLANVEPHAAIAIDAAEEIVAMDLSALQPAGHLSPQRATLFHGATADALLVFDGSALGVRLRTEIRGGSVAA